PSPTPPPSPLTLGSCDTDPSQPVVNVPMYWRAIGAGGGVGPLTYTWSGTDISTRTTSQPSLPFTYTSLTPSNKLMTVSVTDGVTTKTANCNKTLSQAFVGTCPNKSVIMTSSGLSVPFSWAVSLVDNLPASAQCTYSWLPFGGEIPALTNPVLPPACSSNLSITSNAISYSATGTKMVNLKIHATVTTTLDDGTPVTTSTDTLIPCSANVIDPKGVER
ncbi:MAG: hypothetical protein PHN89_03835, partial [Candidatus Pacebacteria bacterium]|nr:hypothetical protein [Candidatus Paceibacterota bacterium]